MTKKYLLSTVTALALGFVISCDNTTDDPPNQNNTATGGTTITGPRILSKVSNGTKDLEEYITNNGILSQVFIRDAGSTNMYTATVTYTGDKVTKIKYQDNLTPHVIDNTYTITYTSGKMTSLTLDNATTFSHSDFNVFYDGGGQLYRIEEKKKMGSSTAYTHYTEYKFTFSSSNVVRVDNTSMLISGGTPDAATASTTTYTYDNYDTKINPYTL